jgi:hypothetical protein
MRKVFLLFMFFTVCVNVKAALGNRSSFNITNTVSIKKDEYPARNLELLAKMRIKQIESYLGRKLKFKEKLAIKLLKFQVKHGLKSKGEPTSKKGKDALTLGILSLVTLLLFPLATIPLAILAIINGNKAKKLNPNDGDAKAGIILGIISLSFIALAIIAVIIVISSLTMR